MREIYYDECGTVPKDLVIDAGYNPAMREIYYDREHHKQWHFKYVDTVTIPPCGKSITTVTLSATGSNSVASSYNPAMREIYYDLGVTEKFFGFHIEDRVTIPPCGKSITTYKDEPTRLVLSSVTIPPCGKSITTVYSNSCGCNREGLLQSRHAGNLLRQHPSETRKNGGSPGLFLHAENVFIGF